MYLFADCYDMLTDKQKEIFQKKDPRNDEPWFFFAKLWDMYVFLRKEESELQKWKDVHRANFQQKLRKTFWIEESSNLIDKNACEILSYVKEKFRQELSNVFPEEKVEAFLSKELKDYGEYMWKAWYIKDNIKTVYQKMKNWWPGFICSDKRFPILFDSEEDFREAYRLANGISEDNSED